VPKKNLTYAKKKSRPKKFLKPNLKGARFVTNVTKSYSLNYKKYAELAEHAF